MIIGFSGKRGTGKTTAANYLIKKYQFTKVGFADDLKIIARTLYPFTERDLGLNKETKYKDHDWTPRDFMIHLGELMRYHEPNYWLNRGIAKCNDTTKNYCFDDVRFTNEADAIKALGGKIIRIERYEKLNPFGKNLDIPSETDLDKYTFDFTILKIRNVSMTSLERQLDGYMSE